MTNLIIIFGLFVLGKLAINFSKYQTCKKYQKNYKNNLRKPEWEFWELQPQIVKLFKDAGVGDSYVSVVQPIGYNQISTNTGVSVMSNIGNNREDVVGMTQAMFHKSIGIYRSRMFDAINPIYWIEFVIYLPKNMFQYVGASSESTLVKSVQVIYWLVAGVISFLFGVFGDEINTYIKEILLNSLHIK